MEMIIVKYGNLMGSPDVKAMMHGIGADTPEADMLFDEIYHIKLRFGLNGQSTSVILVEPECPELFPALVDFSFISADPATHGDASLSAALEAVAMAGIRLEEVKSLFVTHPHGDHLDPRLAPKLPNAKIYADPDSGMPGARPLPKEKCPSTFVSLNTPGHGGPHCSYLVDLPHRNLSVCLAGDLVMSHAHYLSLEHPLSFSNHKQGMKSVEAVKAALAARPLKFKMILPGHDAPFFVDVE